MIYFVCRGSGTFNSVAIHDDTSLGEPEPPKSLRASRTGPNQFKNSACFFAIFNYPFCVRNTRVRLIFSLHFFIIILDEGKG